MSNDVKSNLRNFALSLLARREHSEKELLTKIRRKGIASEMELSETVETLKQEGYLSDQRFAESYVRSRSSRGFGRDKIELELREKGVSYDVISSALDVLENDWPSLIFDVWRKKFYAAPQQFSEKVKQHNFLRYRGFRSEDIEGLYAEIGERF